MKAYKVFDSDWKCRGFQYEVGKTYTLNKKLIWCRNGFHACKKLIDCFSYYDFDPKNKVAEVELIGKIVGEDKNKQATDKIKIVRELSWEEVLIIVNVGKGNSGHSNSGHSNSGDSNSGDSNSGNRNSGDSNSGNRNSGDSNSGHWNSGDSNSGNRNSGNRNSGHSNSGHWNSGHCNSGLFNTNIPCLRMFNKDTKYYIQDLDIPSFLYFDLTQWVSYDTATDFEREKYKSEIETCGGFTKTLDYKTAFKRAWNNASVEDRNKVKSLPNFDAGIFYEISGIKV